MFALTKKLVIYEGNWVNNGKEFCLKEYRSSLQKNQIIAVLPTKEEAERLKDYIITPTIIDKEAGWKKVGEIKK